MNGRVDQIRTAATSVGSAVGTDLDLLPIPQRSTQHTILKRTLKRHIDLDEGKLKIVLGREMVGSGVRDQHQFEGSDGRYRFD